MNKKHRSIIKKIRKLRGVSQKQLGDLIGSQSMVSRIENNQTEPTDQTLFLLCQALDISFDEYFDSVFGSKISNMDKLDKILFNCYVDNNRTELNYLQRFYQKELDCQPDNITIFHESMMVQGALFRLDFKKAQAAEQKALMDYFFNVQEWQCYDLRLLSWTISLLDITKLRIYLADIVRQNCVRKISCQLSELIGKIIISALETSIVQRELSMSEYLVSLGQRWRRTDNAHFDFKTWLLFLNGIFERKLQGRSAGDKKIEHAYHVALYLHSRTTIVLFDRFLKKMHIAKPSNNL